MLDRQARAFLWAPQDCNRVLDFGCRSGDLIGRLALEGIGHEWVGCDVDSSVIELAARQYPAADFKLLEDGCIPYEDGYFDTVFMLDVLEHVPSEEDVMTEIARVMRHDGTLILSVPHAGPFAWLDTGNLKFRFPRFHKAFYRYVLRDMTSYQRKFADTRNGLFGDVSVSQNMWHRHYSLAQISAILGPYFSGLHVKYFSMVPPVWDSIIYLYSTLTKRKGRLVEKVLKWDLSLELGRFSYNVMVKVARK